MSSEGNSPRKTSVALLCHPVTAQSSKLCKASELPEIFNLLPMPEKGTSWKIRFQIKRNYICFSSHPFHSFLNNAYEFICFRGNEGLCVLYVCMGASICASACVCNLREENLFTSRRLINHKTLAKCHLEQGHPPILHGVDKWCTIFFSCWGVFRDK